MNRAALLATLLTLVAACGGGSSTTPPPPTKAYCTSSCPRSCMVDNDCKDSGQLCCDYGGGARSCARPQACPVFCTNDSKCNTAKGEVCCQANASSTMKVCVQAASCPKQCSTDSQCAGNTPKCCTDYAQPFCTAVSSCPRQCSTSSQCDTTSGQTCCSAMALKAYLKQYSTALSPSVAGLCEAAQSCPKTCVTSQDCNTGAGQLCCDGLCSTSCDKTCMTDNDCPTDRGQLCCNNPVTSSPWYGWTPPAPPQTCSNSRCSGGFDCSNGEVCCDFSVNHCASCSGFCTTASSCQQNAAATCE